MYAFIALTGRSRGGRDRERVVGRHSRHAEVGVLFPGVVARPVPQVDAQQPPRVRGQLGQVLVA